jgi:hypothetical protein
MEQNDLSHPVELSEEQLDQVTGGTALPSGKPPGQFPSGNPSTAPGNSNEPGQSG